MRTHKQQSSRTVPLTSRVVEEFDRMQSAKNTGGRIFGDLKSIRRSFGTAYRIAGIVGVTPHVLRHTYGSVLLMFGATDEAMASAVASSTLVPYFCMIELTNARFSSSYPYRR